MLITKVVHKRITPSIAKKYRDLGYEIPNTIPKQGIFLDIKVTDLSRRSRDKVEYQCDCCGKIYSTDYGNYYHCNHNGKYYCNYCSGKVLNSGSNCYLWKDSLTEQDRIKRRMSPEYLIWSKKYWQEINIRV